MSDDQVRLALASINLELAIYYNGSKPTLQPSPLTSIFMCLPYLGRLPQARVDIFGPCYGFSSYGVSNCLCGGIPSHPVLSSRSLEQHSGTSSSFHVGH